MKILVLGAGGMAGHVITLKLKKEGYDVTGLARRELNFCKSIVADVTDTVQLKQIIKDYDVVVNAVGILIKAINDNPYNGIWINSCLPHFLAENTTAKIIHLSTDCIFSGHDNGNYTENSLPTETNFYGRSKNLGELNDNKNLTFRMSIVGPDINKNGVGLFNWFMQQTEKIGGYTTAIWTGVTTITLANAISEALKQNLTGLYHLVNNEKITKFELLKLFNNLRKEKLEILQSTAVNENKSLINTRKDFNFIVPGYEDMVQEMGVWIKEHKELYPQYE
jgi:dTDP-4-dehydrorhamnose reductase